MSLENRKVILGVTGGIAAYKAAELCRLLTKSGALVRVVMTQGAIEFIQPLTFQALSGNPVSQHLLDEEAEAGMGHIELAKWADLILIAPTSANTLAKLAHGFADDLLSTLILATSADIAIAPAMNQQMWANPATQANLKTLIDLYGSRLTVLGPGAGEQACGDVGLGRMLEPVEIVEKLLASEKLLAAGLKIAITAGPTREAIDPVRYISNHSSGKMGFALAEAFRALGATVTLISGPVSLSAHPAIDRIDVESAREMYEAALKQSEEGFDIFIGSAAVADYRPASVAEQKIKKQGDDPILQLIENPDVIANVSKQSSANSLIVGFAAETNNVIEYAESKLTKKNLDLVIANDVSDQTIGFNSDVNQVSLVSAAGTEHLPRLNKQELSHILATKLMHLLREKRKRTNETSSAN